MKKYRINWIIVFRNISIIFLLIVCVLSNKQIEDNTKKLEELDKEYEIALKSTQHSLKSKLYHKPYNYIANEEKDAKNDDRTVQDNRIYLGNFKITHYCPCTKCCGPNAQGITASGKRVQEGVTIAVDKSKIKLGSKVYIEGYGERIAQDTGSAIKGNRIDVYVADHNEALKLGVINRDVWLVKEV